jgi:hypothetical protein
MADYLEGHLPLGKRALFDAHLDDCSDCLDEIREVQRTITLLRSLPEPEVPAGFSESVMRLVSQREGMGSWLDSLREAINILLGPRVLVPASVAMIAIGIVVGSGQVQEALMGVGPDREFAGQVRSTDGAQLAGIPVAGNAGEGEATERSRPSSILQIRLEPGLVSNSLPGPVRLPSRQVFELGQSPPLYSILAGERVPGSRAIRGNAFYGLPRASGQTGVLRVATPGQVGHPERPGFATQIRSHEEQSTVDEWLVRLRRSPDDFVLLLSNSTLAEQELWIANLARHATERGELNDIISTLRESSSEKAKLLAEDFASFARGPIANGSGARNHN